ncbi:MAG: hypothetical protein K1X67_26690 [Fimbriimonadaceae bacterium]|nr:hypothetical protein [Fimbriimonadaceae bacterium]
MVRVFVIDDTGSSLEPLGKAAGEDCDIYCLDDVVYQTSESVDKFFGRILTDNVWHLTPGRSLPAGCFTELAPTDTVAIFVIHVHAKITANSYRQSQDGVEILKHIRLTEELGHLRTAHVVLCSFEDPIALLTRKPGNLIILSRGTTVLRLPDSQRELEQRGYLAARAEIKAEISLEAFAPYVRCDFQEVDSAHQFSNWWGLRQIAIARHMLKKTSAIVVPEAVKIELGKLRNKKIQFLFGHDIIGETADNWKKPSQRHEIVYIDDEEGWGATIPPALREDLGSDLTIRYCLPPLVEGDVSEGTPGGRQTIFDNLGALEEWVRTTVIGEGHGPSLVLLDLRLLGGSEVDVPVENTSGVKIAETIRRLHAGLPIVMMTASNKAYTFKTAMKHGIDGYWMKEGVGEHAPKSGPAKNYIELLNLISTALGTKYQFLRAYSKAVEDLKAKRTDSLWWVGWQWPNNDSTSGQKDSVMMVVDGTVTLLREYLRLFEMKYGFMGENAAIKQRLLSALMVEAGKVVELVHDIPIKLGQIEQRLEQVRQDRQKLIVGLGEAKREMSGLKSTLKYEEKRRSMQVGRLKFSLERARQKVQDLERKLEELRKAEAELEQERGDTTIALIAKPRNDARGYFLYQQRNAAAHARTEAKGSPQIEFAHVQSMLSGVVTWLSEPMPKNGGILDFGKRGKSEIENVQMFNELNGNGTFTPAPR